MFFPRVSLLITPFLLSSTFASPIERNALSEARQTGPLIQFDTYVGLSCSASAGRSQTFQGGELFGVTYHNDFSTPVSSFGINKTQGKCTLRLYTGKSRTGTSNLYAGLKAPACIQVVSQIGQAVTFQSFEVWCDGP